MTNPKAVAVTRSSPRYLGLPPSGCPKEQLCDNCLMLSEAKFS